MALDRFLKRSSKTLEDDVLYKCCIKSTDLKLSDIQLTSETPIYIGRSPETGITDVCCSRRQIKLTPNLKCAIIYLKVCGTNLSALNGAVLEHDKTYEARHGDVIEILHERYLFKVVFDPEPNYKNGIGETSKKMKLDEQSEPQNGDKSKETGMKSNVIWQSIDNDDLVICTCEDQKPSDKIAAYDLDNTIIKTRSGNVHPKDITDWQIAYSEVIGKLKTLHDNDFKIVLFTNQAPIGYGRVQLKDFKKKIENIIKKLSIPVQVFIATKSNFYRKPRTGMWEYMENHKNDNKIISKEKSFYVGDAAGRLQQTKPIKHKKDHSCADRLFALNIGLQFFTPEEHFLNRKPLEYAMPCFNPKQLQQVDYTSIISHYNISISKCEMIVMVGLPGSGKSYFAKEILENAGYKIINRDTLGTIEKCIKLCEETLLKKQKCVIDNTNVDLESRKRFINLSKKYSIDCRCFLMNISLEQIKHNLVFRELTDSTHVKIKEPIFFSLKKKYVEPRIDEGFKEIVKIESIPCRLKDDFHEKLYKMYLVEK